MNRLNFTDTLLRRTPPISLALAGALLFISGCQSGATVPDAPPESSTVSTPMVDDEPGDEVIVPSEVDDETAITAPDDADAIADLLRARHTEDLPDGPTLHAYETGEASLIWLATNGDSALIKTRAMSALRFFDSAESRTLLQTTLAEPSTHATLQAAALTGLGGQDLSADDTSFDLLVDALNSTDPRVSVAAVNTLASVPRGVDTLQTAFDAATLNEVTLDQIRAAIDLQ